MTVYPFTGNTFTGAVAKFTDANPFGMVSDYQAIIDWGDGTTGSGLIQVDPNGNFDVIGSHAYALAGSYAIGVYVEAAGRDLGPNVGHFGISTGLTFRTPLVFAP